MAENKTQYVIGVDLGGTNARIVLARPNGVIIREVSYPSRSQEPSEKTMDVIADGVHEVVRQEQCRLEQVLGIGVGLPGIITSENHCVWSPNFPLWRDVAIKEMLENQLHRPSFFLNDARCATLGELIYGAGRGSRNLVYVGLGTGIGGGIVFDGRLVLGPSGSVGEIAHHTIDPDGPLCGCGHFGCWEAFCGRDAIVRRAVTKLQRGRASQLASWDRPLETLTPKDITEAARQGDPLACEVVEEIGFYVGLGIANLINMLAPDRVVIGGGIAQAGDILYGPLQRTLQARAVPFQLSACQVVPAELGSNAGVQGAVYLALWQLGLETL